MAQANHTSGNKNNQQFPPLVSQKPSIQAVMEVVLDTQARAASPRTGQIDPFEIMTSTKQLPSQHFADYSFVF
jgi:hypothetical protein